MLACSSETEAPASDALSEVLQDLRLTDGSYGRCELSRPWGIQFPPVGAARFHFVVSGECWLKAPRRGWIQLREGDVVLLPHGTGHALSDSPPQRPKRLTPLEQMPLEEIGERTYRMRAGGRGARTVLVCCSVGFGQPGMHPLLEQMPPALLVRGGGHGDPALPGLLEAMSQEVNGQRLGAATIMTRLADVVITRLIRAWAESRRNGGEEASGWLAGIRDPQIGRALAAMHQQPGEPWTVDSLAGVAKTSRSVFSDRFASVMGVPPGRYLARWRMHLARGWLREERMTVAEAASRLGYESEAAFSRAFKRFAGVPPSTLRRLGRSQP